MSTAHPQHAHGVDPAIRKKSLNRLKRIEGQVRGVARMIEEERYCADVLVQVSAIHESLRSLAQLLLRNHLQYCATDAIRSDNDKRREEMYDELVNLFAKHIR